LARQDQKPDYAGEDDGAEDGGGAHVLGTTRPLISLRPEVINKDLHGRIKQLNYQHQTPTPDEQRPLHARLTQPEAGRDNENEDQQF